MIWFFAVLAAAAAAVVLTFNLCIRRRNLVREGWSGVDVQLKRRHDLIPQLTDTIKGYVRHEKSLLEDLTRNRVEAMKGADAAGSVRPERELSKSLRSVLVAAEAYPDLKASANFLDLQKSLSAVEDELQMARRYYNATVRDYNTLIQSFPGNLLAGLFGFKPLDFFEIETATERQSPSVNL